MTGRIEALGSETSPGFIKAENDVIAFFNASDVSPRGAKDLAVGQLVTFDLEKGDSWPAVNISVERQHYGSHGAEKIQRSVRYMGFKQTGNIRAYEFERLSPEGATQTATVSTDLALFLKHHVRIQDGPALCLRLAMAELDVDNADGWSPIKRSLTDQDMQVHLPQRATTPKKRLGGRRPAPNPNVGKHWRGTGPRVPPSSAPSS
jgi:cold shock CspA family protein